MDKEDRKFNHEQVDPQTRLLTILGNSKGDGLDLHNEWLALEYPRPDLTVWLIERISNN